MSPPPPIDCATCGACCREGFDSVPVADDDLAVRRSHPELLVRHEDGWMDLRRVPSPDLPERTRCAALTGAGTTSSPYRCTIYACRPAACSDLDVGSESCVLARRRVGLEKVQ